MMDLYKAIQGHLDDIRKTTCAEHMIEVALSQQLYDILESIKEGIGDPDHILFRTSVALQLLIGVKRDLKTVDQVVEFYAVMVEAIMETAGC
jgi:hypothetical protein